MNADSEKLHWEAGVINNESVTWCTDRACRLHNGGIQLVSPACTRKPQQPATAPSIHSTIVMKPRGLNGARFLFSTFSTGFSSSESDANVNDKDLQNWNWGEKKDWSPLCLALNPSCTLPAKFLVALALWFHGCVDKELIEDIPLQTTVHEPISKHETTPTVYIEKFYLFVSYSM